MRASPAGKQAIERTAGSGKERLGDASRRLYTHCVAVTGHVFHGDPTFFPDDPNGDGPARSDEGCQPRFGVRGAARGTRLDFHGRQVAEPPKQVVQPVSVGGLPVLGEGLKGELEVRQGGRIQQLPQLLLSEELAQQVAVKRECLGAPLREGGVTVVHVGRDIVEQERRCEWRRTQGFHAVHADLVVGAGADADREEILGHVGREGVALDVRDQGGGRPRGGERRQGESSGEEQQDQFLSE